MSDQSLVVRAASPGDRRALVLLVAMLQDHERSVRPTRRPGATMADGYVAALLERLGRDDGTVIVGAIDGEVVGMAAAFLECDRLEVEPREIKIEDLVVAAAYRRRGVARALVDAVAAFGRSRGVRRLVVSALAPNAAARATYRALGFHDALVSFERRS